MRLRACGLLLWAWSAPALAIGVLQIDDTRSLSFGLGLRGSVFEPQPLASPALGDELVVLGVTGVAASWLRVQGNLAAVPTGIQLLDAIAMFEPNPLVKLWAGHLLPPGDRESFSGPFFADSWDLPFVSRYPGQFGGRDDGAVVWGEWRGGVFKYEAGAFAGRHGAGTSNPGDIPLFAGRLVANLLDPEPGYYNMSSYLGSKDVLAIGVGARYQRRGAGTATASGGYGTYDLDVLFEKRLGGYGAVTVDGALYRYETGGVADPSLLQGNGGFLLLGYVIPRRVGPGQVQPIVRYQALRLDAGGTHQRYDVGVNYAVAGPYVRCGLEAFVERTATALPWSSGLKLGIELVL